ncbi:MAG: type II secretion system F family protein [Inquilinus limosus]|uniref:Type II secretion system F family protein n=1 Tax=Inquilinus limosus TaxID=171674 RepID=A0A952FLR9_9PROT|nr:type II secretion system F family protein [Inquilinus limosus]
MTGFGFLLVGVVALFVMAGISLFAGRRQRRQQQLVQTRLEVLRGVLPQRAGETVAGRPPVPAGQGGPRFLRLWMHRADIVLQPHRLVTAALLVIAATVAVAWFFGPIAAAVVPVLAMGIAVYALHALATRRINAFILGLPFFLDALRQLLMVGNSMQQGLLKAAENTSPAMQRYLQPMIRRINNGAPIPEAVSWLAARLDVPELHMVATATEVNFRYGGRMSTVLANLVQILRDRTRVERELKAATAEIRFSAIVLGLMPAVVAVMIGVVKPAYVMFFIEAEQGPRLALIAVGLQVFGVLVMRRIMRLEF